MMSKWYIVYQVNIKGKWYAKRTTFITKAAKQTVALRCWLYQRPNRIIQIDKFSR